MKTNVQMLALAVILGLLLPGVLLAGVLLTAGVRSAVTSGLNVSDFIVIAVLAGAFVIFVFGCRLLSELRRGYNNAIRWRLFGFYCVVFAYCISWLFSRISFDGASQQIFTNAGLLIGVIVFSVPILLVLFTPATNKVESCGQDEPSSRICGANKWIV